MELNINEINIILDSLNFTSAEAGKQGINGKQKYDAIVSVWSKVRQNAEMMVKRQQLEASKAAQEEPKTEE